jgi:hypothetical protein
MPLIVADTNHIADFTLLNELCAILR